MAWFFSNEEIHSDVYVLSGDDLRHAKVLRLRAGEPVTVVTPRGEQCACVCESEGVLRVTERFACQNEPDVFVTLYQALPKGDKMDYIIQKCVELGVSRIVPMITSRCVSRPDGKALRSKRERWQKIALQAAMQSRRGRVPEVCACVTFAEAAELTRENEATVFFYELGGEPVRDILSGKPKTIGVFIGSEGGFAPEEVDLAVKNGGKTATLGRRILRAETAPLAALSIIMYQTGNFD